MFSRRHGTISSIYSAISLLAFSTPQKGKYKLLAKFDGLSMYRVILLSPFIALSHSSVSRNSRLIAGEGEKTSAKNQ